VVTIRLLGSGTAAAQSQWTTAFVQRLRELGWTEGPAMSRSSIAGARDAPSALPSSKLHRTSRPKRPYADLKAVAVSTASAMPIRVPTGLSEAASCLGTRSSTRPETASGTST
jgi:hypothetical protein